MEPYFIPDQHTWDAVSKDLIHRALTDPLPEPDSNNYSGSEEEAFAKVEAANAEKRAYMVRHGALVVFNKNRLFSITLTKEPGCMHLSMTAIIPGIKMDRMSDEEAFMVADEIIGPPYSEVKEGVLPTVRHFYSCQ